MEGRLRLDDSGQTVLGTTVLTAIMPCGGREPPQ